MHDRMEEVDFVVRGLDDDGRPSRAFLQVTEVSLIDEKGQELGRFRDAGALDRFLFKVRGKVKLIAIDTLGLPRLDLAGKYCCYEQGSWHSMRETRHG